MEDRHQLQVHSTFGSQQTGCGQSHHDCPDSADSSTNRTNLALGWSKLRPLPI